MKPGHAESNTLVLVTLSLLAFGLVMVYSATSAAAAIGDGEPIYYLKKQGSYALLGLVLLIVLSRWRYRALRLAAPTLLVVSVVLLVAVLILGEPVNGARRWLQFGAAVFQPSELAKLAVIVWAAALLARRGAPQTMGDLVKPLGVVTGLFCVLLIAEPDLGTSIVLCIVIGGMLLVTGAPMRLLGAAGGLATACLIAAIWVEPYRRARIFSFLNPWDDAQGAGYQTTQAITALGSGGPLGKGLGQSVGKIFYLPEAHTDMIYAVIGEELGLLGAALVLAAFVAFGWAGLRIALRAKDPFGKALASGITIMVCGQAALNLAAVVGLAPLTGITLPLVSYGGSSLLVVLASVGILLNIGRGEAAETRAVVPDRSRRDVRSRRAVARSGRSTAQPRRAGELRRLA